MSAAKKKREKFQLPPRMTDAEMEDFVKRWLAGAVTTSAYVPRDLLGSIFMPLAFGALAGATKKQIEQIGLIWADNDRDPSAPGRALNGFRMFASCRLMLKADWEIVRATINREAEAPTHIKLEKP